MSILVLWASPNLDGLTATAKDRVVAGIRAAGKEAEVIHLNSKQIQMCRACGSSWGTCLSKGSCVIRDDFEEIYTSLRKAESFVIITPVYFHDMAETFKAFLDRLRRCEPYHNRYLEGKRCMLVACAGGTGNGPIRCLRVLEECMAQLLVQPLERIPVIRFNREYMLPALESAGKQFAENYDTWKLK